MPKFNLYQSLHTTVVGPQGKPLEVQIRTREMHHRAEFGIAAHWGYKENAAPAADIALAAAHRRLAAGDRRPRRVPGDAEARPRAGRGLRLHAKGDVVTLPVGATPIDFAYAIHTEVGHRCIGARVNGRLVPLDSQLSVGRHGRDLHVEGAEAGPSRDWLKIVVTPRARNKIRQWFSRERREDAIENGREELVKAHAQGGPAGPEAGVVAGAGEAGRVDELRRPRRAARRHRRGPRVGQVGRAADRPGAAGRRPRGAAADHGRAQPRRPSPAARRSASTSRASTT